MRKLAEVAKFLRRVAQSAFVRMPFFTSDAALKAFFNHFGADVERNVAASHEKTV